MTDGFERDLLAYLPDVMRFAGSLERDPDAAADLVQDTYLHGIRGRASYDPARPLRPWLFTICRNLFLRRRDRARLFVEVEDDATLEVLANMQLHNDVRATGISDPFLRMDFGPALDRAMTALADPYRIVFALVDVGEHSYREAAEALGLPIGTIRSRLFRARRELQAALIEHARDAGILNHHSQGGTA
ncbi:MAG: RNA polymerase sigma factor [Gemmatimonadetes bacterium]|nr:RNA polymerase sigma factor [Gemmatimonadota bacterium]MCA9768286.1 RNA polymerase sigma factor [Gemmatimonadota bacterium]